MDKKSLDKKIDPKSKLDMEVFEKFISARMASCGKVLPDKVVMEGLTSQVGERGINGEVIYDANSVLEKLGYSPNPDNIVGGYIHKNFV